MSSFDVLRTYLSQRAVFNEDDIVATQSAFVERRLLAGEFLQRAGDVARVAAFVATGCLRSYIVDAKGKEHIVQFAPETWWLADGTSLMTGTPSQYFFDAVEDSDLLVIDGPSHAALVDRVAPYAEAFRNGLQKHASAKDRRIATSLSASAEERYLDFLAAYPSIVQRVPQWMLASYLGITPETLSRVRKNLARR